ncbi:hypothetical protein DIPPA_16287 [Diplonema papillatum]|nr:hypothetical protein DIPPA_16287 [Diplonema papillatum]
MKRVRGHEDDGVDPALLSAKPYKITKKAAEVKQKGNCGGCGVDVKPEPADPLSHAAMARLRGQVLGGTLPRLVKTPPADIKLRKEPTDPSVACCDGPAAVERCFEHGQQARLALLPCRPYFSRIPARKQNLQPQRNAPTQNTAGTTGSIVSALRNWARLRSGVTHY